MRYRNHNEQRVNNRDRIWRPGLSSNNPPVFSLVGNGVIYPTAGAIVQNHNPEVHGCHLALSFFMTDLFEFVS
ncbi:hypothetical protein AG1IA_08631 [Rhizoctonia solani AG-1 IA]|uniref:Uncharacterized protein n=1 Tax=Thanatephorus cucumeris (strain AG1-IA) TaxID=983506 RepID=L8WKT4_THACA|nr:hypothetical protein AG1IA_08631 [Rhizoctonia solani AG-1 IA]